MILVFNMFDYEGDLAHRYFNIHISMFKFGLSAKIFLCLKPLFTVRKIFDINTRKVSEVHVI